MSTWAGSLERPSPTAPVRLAITVLASLMVGAVVVVTNGNLAAPIALPVGIGVLITFVARPGWAFSFLLFAALLFEQYQIFGLDAPLTLQIPFFENFNNSIGIPLPTNPVECLLGLMLFSWLMNMVVTRRFRWQHAAFHGPVALFAVVLLTFMAWGIARGGVPNIVLWEVRALFYFIITYFVGSQLVRTKQDVIVNTWCILIPIAIKGFQGVWRYVVDLKGDIGDVPAITSHECAVFIMTSFVFSIAAVLLRGPRGMILFTALTAPTTFITFIYAQRRIAYGAVVIGIIILFFFLEKRLKRLFFKAVIPAIPVLAVYFVVFWNSSSGLAMPVQQVRSIFGEDASGEEDSSNEYREIEKFNLEETIRTFPAGVGFGNKYLIVLPLDEVDFPLWDYIPHNCIYWFWVKTGFIGMTLFFAAFGLLVIQLAMDYRATTRPFYRVLLITLIVFVINQVIVAYYDLQLTFYRNMVYLGAFLATMIPVHMEARRNRELAEAGLPLIDPNDPEPQSCR